MDIPSGPDAGMFEALRVDDDTIPRNGYEHMLATARPLPGGEYVVLYNRQLYVYFPCNFVPDDTYIEWTVTVTPPLDTVHEAFFDPVADGAAVGYTAGAGRLEPAAFDFDGTTIEITDLHWDEGSVSLTVDPPGGLTDFALEFIALDGTTSRRLSGSAATEDAGTGVITWQVSVPTWEDGDLVLLRISEGGGDPSPVPAEEPTATPEPTETPTPEPGPQEDEAWLEPDPEGATLDGQWREFTVRAPGVRRPEVAFNVIGYGGAPTSTGAVALSAADTPPDAGEACESASYGSLRVTEGGTFWLVGCEAGTVVIEILDPCNGRALLKRYSVAVSGGP